MTPSAALPPIGGFILTGQLITRQAAHAPVILRHDLTTDFFGIEERAASWPGFRSFQVFPISDAALARLLELLGDDDRHEIDTRHSGFGWIPRPKVPAPHLMGLPVGQPPLFVTVEEKTAHRAVQPVRPARAPMEKLKPCPWCGNEVEIETLDDDHTKAYGVHYWIAHYDPDCQMHMIETRPFDTKEELIKFWNTRKDGNRELACPHSVAQVRS